MSRPPTATLRAAQAANQRLAGRDTPFIFNEWYVAAFSQEVTRSLLARTLLGRRVVLFRAQAGRPAALEDRCAHRAYPLSASHLEGDTIICGYHGFRYNLKGDCMEVPSMPQGRTSHIGVHAYPTLELGGVVWIWMGDPALADPARIPAVTSWMASSDWATAQRRFDLKANYVALHENLLDTSHLSFIHSNTIGSPDYVRAPTEQEVGPGRFALIRTVSPTRVPPVWAHPTGLVGVATAARIVRNEFLSPGCYEATTRLFDMALPAAGRPEFRIKAAHLITPETQGTTHYFTVLGRDFSLLDDDIGRAMAQGMFRAFEEDLVALALVDARNAEADHMTCELSVASDGLGIAMRRYLKQRADEDMAAMMA